MNEVAEKAKDEKVVEESRLTDRHQDSDFHTKMWKELNKSPKEVTTKI